MRVFVPLLVLQLIACDAPGESSSIDSTDVELDTADTASLGDYQVTLVTTLGAITVTLDPDHAPSTVDNFMRYASSGFYDGDDGFGATTFHRVIEDFMIQGGGYTVDGVRKRRCYPLISRAITGFQTCVVPSRWPVPTTPTPRRANFSSTRSTTITWTIVTLPHQDTRCLGS